jgi:hypothetical protein
MNSVYFGSTVAPTMAIIDSDGETVLESVTGTSDNPTAAIENLPVIGGQTYYIRFTHIVDSDTGLSAWYEFNTFIADFEIGNYGCPP